MTTETLLFFAATDHHELPMGAPTLFTLLGLPVSNSMLMAWAAAILLIWVAIASTKNVSLVPSKLQNFVEWLIEGIFGLLEGIVGRELALKTFWFFATLFLFILTCNLLALIPGVGTIGFGQGNAHGFTVTEPFMRGANADVNLTAAMAIVFMVVWLIWAIQANGVKGFLHHIFGSKASLPGALGVVMVLVFLFVGCLEVISIAVRPVALTFRLYGNIYGGEAMIDTLKHLAGNWAWLALIPVYCFELLVALVQALVFFLLTAVFTGMMCKHEEHGGGSHSH